MKEDLEEQIRCLKNIIVQMSYDLENKDIRLMLLYKQRDKLNIPLTNLSVTKSIHKLLTKHK